MLFPTTSRDYVWRTLKEAYNPEFLVPAVEHSGRSVMIRSATSWYSAGPKIALNDRITASDYVDILGKPVHPTVQMLLPINDAVFEDDSCSIHTAGSVQSWIEEHEDAIHHLPWPAQSPTVVSFRE